MFKAAIGLMLAALVCGCVSTKTVAVDDAVTREFQGKTITSTRRAIPDFAATTAGKASFGLIGATAMISAGNRIVRENKVEDPADYMSSRLVAELAQKHGLTVLDNTGKRVSDEAPEMIAKLHADAHYVLDVRTVNWGFSYFPTDWNSYAVSLGSKLRVIDASNGKVMAEAYCFRMPEKTDSAPSHDELLANQAQRLKEELRNLADYCMREFKANALKL